MTYVVVFIVIAPDQHVDSVWWNEHQADRHRSECVPGGTIIHKAVYGPNWNPTTTDEGHDYHV